jgi:hypothetical protein
MAEYQALKALSAGGAWTLSEVCPAHYWATSPFNPDALPQQNKREFDIGTAAHIAVLEPHLYSDRVVEVPFDSYKPAVARSMRDAVWEAGKTPLKPSEVEIVNGVRDAIQRNTAVAKLFTGGVAEVACEWETYGVPCKCRPDYLTPKHIVDLKTVHCAHPRAAAMAAVRDGWHLRDVWYREGVTRHRGGNKRQYLFVCVEKTPPYLIEVYTLDERAIAWGEQVMLRALKLFRQLRAAGCWPGYNDYAPVKLSLPAWSEYQLADREQAGEFSDAEIRRGNEWLAP